MASTFLAKKMMEKKVAGAAGSMQEPLISSEGKDGEGKDAEKGEGGENKGAEEVPDKLGGLDMIIICGAIVSMLLSGICAMLAMQLGLTLVVVPCVINFVVCPWVICNQIRIARNKSIRGLINGLRDEVNLFAEENEKLTLNIDELETQNDRLKEFEKGLKSICDKQGANVEQLVSLVKDNRVIIDKMKKIIKGDVTQILVRAVLLGDRDKNFTLDDKDIETVLNAFDNVEFAEVDRDKFRTYVKNHDRNVNAVLKLVFNLFDENENETETPEEEQIFNVELAF